MKSFVSIATLCAFVCLGVAAAFVSAKDAPAEVTLKGTAVCTKCELHQTEKCGCALKVTENGKEVIYLIKGKPAKDLHSQICKAPKEGVSVTGVVTEKDGKKTITASKIE